MAPVAAAFARLAPEIDSRTAFTGQHTTLVDSVLGAFDLTPEYDLGIMTADQTLYDVLHAAVEALRGVVHDFRPDMLLAQGDTATVFAAALVGYFERVPVGHVEAGLRSGDKNAPWPEEVFRRLTDVIADHYFAPTPGARDLLLAENVPPAAIFVTGNPVVDALQRVASVDRPIRSDALRHVLDTPDAQLVLLTAHRRESFGEPLERIFDAVATIVDEHPSVHVLYPVHPNPRVQGPAHRSLGGRERIHLTEPLDYFDTVAAMRSARLILTDSGGIQEEAPTFGTPVLVLRDVTERPEGVAAGVARLTGSDAELIVSSAGELLTAARPPAAPSPYGDGRAGERIADIVRSTLLGTPRSTTDWPGVPGHDPG